MSITTFFSTMSRAARLTSYTAKIVNGVEYKLQYPKDSDFWMKDDFFTAINSTIDGSLKSIDKAILIKQKNRLRNMENYRSRAYL